MIKKTIPLLLLLATPLNSQAFNSHYYSISSLTDSTTIIKEKEFEKERLYSCNYNSRSCEIISEIPITETDTPVEVIEDESKNKKEQSLRALGYNHIGYSPKGNFDTAFLPAQKNNGRRVYYIKNNKTNKGHFKREAISYWDSVNEVSSIMKFTPDESHMFYISDKVGVISMYVINPKLIKRNNWEGVKISTKAWRHDYFSVIDNNTVLYTGNTKKNPYVWNLWSYNIAKKTNTLISSNISYASKPLIQGKYIIYSKQHNSGFVPVLFNKETNKEEYFNLPGIKYGKNVDNQSIITIGNLKGVLLKPNNEKKTPQNLLIWLHGGPSRQTSYGMHPFNSYAGYDNILEAIRQNDTLVLKLDYHGSFGFDRKLETNLQYKVGVQDMDDLRLTIDFMKKNHDIRKVYIMGNSYGGYMASKAAVTFPEKLAGVIPIAGVSDWESLLERLHTSIFNIHFGGVPQRKNKVLYKMANIVQYVSKIKDTPMLIIHGEDDRTIPFWQTRLLTDTLDKAGKKYELLSYLGEDHVFKKRENYVGMCKHIITFIGKDNVDYCK